MPCMSGQAKFLRTSNVVNESASGVYWDLQMVAVHQYSKHDFSCPRWNNFSFFLMTQESLQSEDSIDHSDQLHRLLP